MVTDLFAPEVLSAVEDFLAAAGRGDTKQVAADGRTVAVPYPFPSPADWRDCWIYFLMVDRFNNPSAPPRGAWNRKYDFHQGGTFNGIREQLGYIRDLGAGAVWLTPVLKNARPDTWRWNYHGYGIQDFLNVDERFGSDGTRATAERELVALVEEAHARGLYVILDIVLNHAGRVFDYVWQGEVRADIPDNRGLLYGPLGNEPPVQWLNGHGSPRDDWQAPPGWPSGLPPPQQLSPDDAVWPADLQRADFFRRRGAKVTDDPPPDGHIPGDFGVLRQLVADYLVTDRGNPLRQKYGPTPVLDILIRTHQYLITKYDIDGFRIDTVKYVSPRTAEIFGNALREFALAAGKKNFFTFGEIWSGEGVIARYVGRNSSEVYSFGIDAALDFPLFDALTGAAKPIRGVPVEAVRHVFERRKEVERELLSSHGEAGRFFVSFLDNHDQHERFLHPATPPEQLTLALAVLFCLQGIPCLYYGTEQGLSGTVGPDGSPELNSPESVREALWGKAPPFDRANDFYAQVCAVAGLRRGEPALRYGRLYFREVSGNGTDFGHSTGVGGVIAFSRILVDREVLLVANTHTGQGFAGAVLVDSDLNRGERPFRVAYSNVGSTRTGTVRHLSDARFHHPDGGVGEGPAAVLDVELRPMEAQILVPD